MGLAATLLLAGCFSVDDVRNTPPSLVATYNGQFDEIANCISAQASKNHAVTPQFYQRDKRATVILAIPTSHTVAEEYEVQQITNTNSRVTWRNAFVQSPGPNSDRPARQLMERCATPT